MSQRINNKKELFDVLLHRKADILSFGVTRLGVFGSFVKDKVDENSDVDFYIDIVPEKKTLKNLVGLYNLLKNISGRNVEIVTPQSLNKFIGKYIIQEVEYISLAA
jgi:predicted nucleotidyltransferase